MMLFFLLIAIVLPLLFWNHMFPPYPNVKDKDHFYFILVLGCPCLADGSLSVPQKQRIQATVSYYKQGYCDAIIVSGGSIQNEFCEAEIMGKELQKQLKNATIIVEKNAHNTYENFKFCQSIVSNKRILVVSSPSHLRRAYFFAKKFYCDVAVGCDQQKDPWTFYLYEYTRCWIALYWELRLFLKSK